MERIYKHSQRRQRRQFLRKTALTLPAAASLLTLHPLLMSSALASNYGIKGRQAPILDVDYWIDGQGNQTQFDPESVNGKWVYMKFFQNWCPGCHEYGFPALQKVVEAFGDEERVSILAVQTVFEGFAVNTKDRLNELQKRYDLPILMGHDAGSFRGEQHPLTMRQFKSGGTPWVVVVDPKGAVIYNDFHIDANKFIAYLKQNLAG